MPSKSFVSIKFTILEFIAPSRSSEIREGRFEREKSLFLDKKFIFDISPKKLLQLEICWEKWLTKALFPYDLPF